MEKSPFYEQKDRHLGYGKGTKKYYKDFVNWKP